ncbi:MAG: hypothetical protein QM671_14595 [Bacillus sp. (in: firmicutes)]|uniref:hypothetical protein n=1 Tax=Bacillus sp. TaxID=1409 RepID=UPI0039E4F4A3
MKKLSVLMAIIFLVTCFLGKTYYDSKIKADVQGAQHKEETEKQEEENSLKNKLAKLKMMHLIKYLMMQKRNLI